MPPTAALARLARSTPLPHDTSLLQAFARSRADDAFASLVRRHGPMVLGACLRVLGNRHDAEDAFQATFLVLARKPGAVRGSNLAGYLYAVAVRTARGVRAMRDRRERASGGRQPPECSTTPDASDFDTARVIDEELAKLPAHYREAVVLCELRGLSRKQAAAELGVPEGTVSSRLAGAKRKLAARLAARGLAPAVALGALLTPAALSAGLLESAAATARGVGSAGANAAASIVLKAMLFSQLRSAAVGAVLVLACVCGGWGLSGAGWAGPPPADAKSSADPAAKLVERLGSADFVDREAAEKALKELGPAAKPAVLAGLSSADPEVARRCAAILPALRHADWQRARDAFTKDPAAFDHPVWAKLKAVAGDGADARAIFADIVSDARGFVALAEAIENPKAADRLYRAALDRLVRDLKEWQAADPKKRTSPLTGGWTPARGLRPTMLLLGTFPGTGERPAVSAGIPVAAPPAAAWQPLKLRPQRAAPGAMPAAARAAALAAVDDEHASMAGLWRQVEPPAPAAQRLFAAWLAARSDPDMLAGGFRLMCLQRWPEAALAARAVAADVGRPPRARAAAVEYLGEYGGPDDLPLAAALFGDATECAWGGQRPVQVRDVATAAALRMHGLGSAAWGHLSGGFDSDFVRGPALEAAQAKVAELAAARARVAPPPRPKP